MADDDPEGSRVFEEIRAACDADSHIRLLTNLDDAEVNALQRVSAACIQKSVGKASARSSPRRCGSEPRLSPDVGGIPLQMADGAGGLLVDDVAGCQARSWSWSPTGPAERVAARAGSERVRSHFLLPRLILNELSLLRQPWGTAPPPAQPHAHERDPVCGIAVIPADGVREARRCRELLLLTRVSRRVRRRAGALRGLALDAHAGAREGRELISTDGRDEVGSGGSSAAGERS